MGRKKRGLFDLAPMGKMDFGMFDLSNIKPILSNDDSFFSVKRNADRFVSGYYAKADSKTKAEVGYPPDNGMLPFLKRINTNRDVATFSSDSGLAKSKRAVSMAFPKAGGGFEVRKVSPQSTAGFPYLWVRFSSIVAKTYYEARLKRAGYKLENTMDGGTYISIPNTARDPAPGEHKATKQESLKFWRDMQNILTEDYEVIERGY